MTSREIVQTSIVVGGLWLVFVGIQSVAIASISQIDIWAKARESGLDPDILNELVLYLPLYVGVGLLSAIPGLLAISVSGRLSRALTPALSVSAVVEPSLIYAVGVMLLGISIGANGLIGLISTGLSMAALSQLESAKDYSFATIYLPGLTYSTISVLAGYLLFRWGSREVTRAA